MSTTVPRPRRGAKQTRIPTKKNTARKKPARKKGERTRLSVKDRTSRLLATMAGTIRGLREEQALTIEEAAHRGDLHVRHFQKLEHGHMPNVTLGTLAKLGQAFGIDPSDLLRTKGGRSR